MAVNTSRSMNLELAEGRGDGTMRKQSPDRGGVVDPATERVRTHLHPDYGYGLPGAEAEHYTGEESLPR